MPAKPAGDENPIYEFPQEKPDVYETVRVFFADGRILHATWTGKLWWCDSQEPNPPPTRWQRMTSTITNLRDGKNQT